MNDFYRTTTLGQGFLQALNRMVSENHLTDEQAKILLDNFDIIISNEMKNSIPITMPELKVQGELESYNGFDTIWRVDGVACKLSGSINTQSNRIRLLFDGKETKDQKRNK